MDITFLEEKIESVKSRIAAYEAAALALASGVQSYKLDTGQTVETVTNFDVASLDRVLSSLYNQLATLEARLNGGCVIGRPAW